MKYDGMRYEFDAVRFAADMEEAARAMDCRIADMARDVGFAAGSFSRMKAGLQVPNGRVLVAMASWADLDLRTYCTDHRGDSVVQPLPRTIAEAHDTIRKLRAELQELRT